MTLTKKHDFLISVSIVLLFILANILVSATAEPAPNSDEEQVVPSEDVQLSSTVREELLNNPQVAKFPIAVASKDSNVTLSGQVGSESASQLAEELASEVHGVDAVDNRLVVAENMVNPEDVRESCEPKASGIPKIIRPNG